MIVSGKDLATIKKDSLKEKIEKNNYKRNPHLVTILVGNDASSLSYIKGKETSCNYVGIKNTLIHLEETTTIELINKIKVLNKDKNVDGILVQLPLPTNIDETTVLDSIDISKDVDGFHSLNTGYLWKKKECTIPCTAKGILQILDYAKVEIEGKNVCVIGRSNIVGLPIAKLLLDRNASVRILHSNVDVKKYSKDADIIIIAIGKPNFLTSDMVKDNVVVIDVGINKINDKIVGDVEFEGVSKKASIITTVPGGVGPMTISCLLENTYELFLKNIKK